MYKRQALSRREMIFIYSPAESEVMTNENNDVFTMEDEPLATAVQNMRLSLIHIYILAYGRVGRCVQHPLRGDERHDAALTHRVKAFQEEIVVYCLYGGT